MEETVPQSMPAEPVPQEMSSGSGTNTIIAPLEQPKKRSSILWFFIVFVVLLLGGGAYFYYAQMQKPSVEVIVQENKPDEGFTIQSSPAATPTLTSSDSVADIENDLTGTTIESDDTGEFDADLQSLE